MSMAARFFMRFFAWAFRSAAVCGLPVGLTWGIMLHWHIESGLKQMLHALKTASMRSGLNFR